MYDLSNINKNIKILLKELQQVTLQKQLEKPIKLLVVTKGIDVFKIEAAIKSGATNFGESYYQEAFNKWIFLKNKYKNIKLHYIGGVQSNKLRKILSLFDVIQSIDRISLVDKIVTLKESREKDFYIEVKADVKSTNRKGVDLTYAKSLISYAVSKGLKVKGIMGIAPFEDERFKKIATKEFFKKMHNLQQETKLLELSIGMSNDYKIALENGSTMIRVGSKIFK